ncbi:methyltransferase domain-containing protein, partial [Candidatus Sumerlaeota bacterium]|nr:methyltransferase domain-containing protein [Candidatus Sumerlaeota bacterium]
LEVLRALRRRSVEAGCAESIVALAADAQALPFSDEALSSVFTKSVLIHTDLAGTAREISRVLKPDGRAAFIEPQKGNPFAWIYRRTLAPKPWRAITRYFDAEAQQTCIKLIGEGSVRPFYLFSFLAFAFQFAWPNVGRFFGTLRFLHKIDQWLFSRMRWTRSLAWFGVIEVKKRSQKDKEKR